MTTTDPTPTPLTASELLFAAERRLRVAANDYSLTSNRDVLGRLKQAARDYVAVEKAVNASAIRGRIPADTLARLETP